LRTTHRHRFPADGYLTLPSTQGLARGAPADGRIEDHLNLNTLIYYLGRVAILCIQCLPLRLVARLGRLGGGLVFHLDVRHRRVAVQNLAMCFGREKSPAEIQALARENFRRIGENYACAIKTAGMSFEQLQPHLEFKGFEKLPQPGADGPAPSIVAAIGHFGNFELYARIQNIRPDLQGATTYRGLKQSGVNRLMQSLRRVNRCRFFERRTEGDHLREVMNRGGVIIGLLVDQHSLGLHGPFLGHPCHTNLAAAVLALRYDCKLFPIICQRLGLAQWRLEVGERIQTRDAGAPRSSQTIMGDVNQALEAAVRSDPANWFWVHRRWKHS
jgi:KDO2-lipid IV(A) lauroyltransferase